MDCRSGSSVGEPGSLLIYFSKFLYMVFLDQNRRSPKIHPVFCMDLELPNKNLQMTEREGGCFIEERTPWNVADAMK